MNLSTRQADALRHIADHCQKASELAGRIGTVERLKENWEAQYALIRCIEVIGEASTRLGPQFHGEHPTMPWRLITGMRNRLIHGYDHVDVNLLWETAVDDLPGLFSAVIKVLESQQGRDPTC